MSFKRKMMRNKMKKAIGRNRIALTWMQWQNWKRDNPKKSYNQFLGRIGDYVGKE